MTDQINDEDEYEDPPPIVVDNGSSTIKAGFAGENAPEAIFPTVVKHQNLHHAKYTLDVTI